jgi:hypothetical protein
MRGAGSRNRVEWARRGLGPTTSSCAKGWNGDPAGCTTQDNRRWALPVGAFAEQGKEEGAGGGRKGEVREERIEQG